MGLRFFDAQGGDNIAKRSVRLQMMIIIIAVVHVVELVFGVLSFLYVPETIFCLIMSGVSFLFLAFGFISAYRKRTNPVMAYVIIGFAIMIVFYVSFIYLLVTTAQQALIAHVECINCSPAYMYCLIYSILV
eukprot:TRINITY_DN2030_c0_g1_i3.p1 TRINITY_DN2030_c0_g1~~TRINITY_DN2030_c0_g1_i3.p1  ORF type:complete len:144 (+),score=25.51 TRINITY_DN2030_c0_g1_i3:39-434(+)